VIIAAYIPIDSSDPAKQEGVILDWAVEHRHTISYIAHTAESGLALIRDGSVALVVAAWGHDDDIGSVIDEEHLVIVRQTQPRLTAAGVLRRLRRSGMSTGEMARLLGETTGDIRRLLRRPK
jgi:hypothetical protein